MLGCREGSQVAGETVSKRPVEGKRRAEPRPGHASSKERAAASPAAAPPFDQIAAVAVDVREGRGKEGKRGLACRWKGRRRDGCSGARRRDGTLAPPPPRAGWSAACQLTATSSPRQRLLLPKHLPRTTVGLPVVGTVVLRSAWSGGLRWPRQEGCWCQRLPCCRLVVADWQARSVLADGPAAAGQDRSDRPSPALALLDPPLCRNLLTRHSRLSKYGRAARKRAFSYMNRPARSGRQAARADWSPAAHTPPSPPSSTRHPT
jgi:hypothetical protein